MQKHASDSGASPDEVIAGQAVYSRRVLRAYDVLVLGISNRLLWRCPTSRLLDHYNQHVTANHLDVGVGSGFFPDRCQFPSDKPRLALMDMNSTALEYAAERIRRYCPQTIEHSVFESCSKAIEPFDSVAICYLLHCLPGTIVQKAIVFDHLLPLMNSGAVLFGSTLLTNGVSRSWPARRLMAAYNRRGIFSNSEDSLVDLRQSLQDRFCEVDVRTIGCAALFSARKS